MILLSYKTVCNSQKGLTISQKSKNIMLVCIYFAKRIAFVLLIVFVRLDCVLNFTNRAVEGNITHFDPNNNFLKKNNN